MITSLYIHIPFCKNICSYCDFSKMYYKEDIVSNYLDALEKEINLYFCGDGLKTLYIGGGTPSSLSMDMLDKLFSILKRFKFYDKYEFTFECNIEDITEELLSFLKDNRVNRLSIGVESFNKKILKFLNRNISVDIDKKIKLAKKYFSNINIDLIFGINGFSMEDLEEDLDKFLSYDLSHISIYSLILEDNTMLKINNYEKIDDDLSSDMYYFICDTLEKNGYKHVEISNFCKEGFEPMHNLVYWNNEKYYGFGLGAGGFIDNIRYTNTRSINNYLDGKYRYEETIVTKEIDMSNEMILGLRKIEGVSRKEFNDKFNCSIEDVFDTHLLKKNKDYYYIDKNNLYTSNYILKDFIL